MYIKSLFILRKKIIAAQPRVIVNFYETLAAVAIGYVPGPAIKVVVGHQIFFDHPEFTYPTGNFWPRMMQILNNKVCRRGMHLSAALSLRAVADTQDIVCVPPLLRKQVKQQQVRPGNYILCYCTYTGYAEEVGRLAAHRPDMLFLLFTSANSLPALPPNVAVHPPHSELFLQSLAGCDALLTTCGFEALCEALYLGKAFAAVPVHYEQQCNAADFAKLVPLHTGSTFHELPLPDAHRQARFAQKAEPFRAYCTQEEYKLLKAIEKTVYDGRRV